MTLVFEAWRNTYTDAARDGPIISHDGNTLALFLFSRECVIFRHQQQLLLPVRFLCVFLDPSSPAAAPRHRYDLALLHVKAVDDAGHDKDASLKVER